MTTPRIDEFNPYPSYQPGQKEAITRILECLDGGKRLVTLNAPTAAGKSLDLYVLGKVLSQDYDIDRVVYTTPLVALVNQLETNEAFRLMPVLKGKRNYPCEWLGGWYTADDCPFDTWGQAAKAMWALDPENQGKPCVGCEYHQKRQQFMESSFGATTLARYMVDPGIRNSCSAILIDESASLEKTLVDRSTLVLPEEVDINNLRESLVVYGQKLAEKIEIVAGEIEALLQGSSVNTKDLVDRQRLRKRLDSELGKCSKVLGHIDNKTPHIIDRERKFRILEGTTEFKRMIDGLELVVLASGTPCTEIFGIDHVSVDIQHPIPLENRRCYYYPVGAMSYQDRAETAPKMAEAIERLHGKYGKKTMVHCGAYNVARLLFDHMTPEARKITVLQGDRTREEDKERFLAAQGERIMLSVYFTEGLDLKGPDYPMNLIAKLPFENIKDEFVAARNELDGGRRYNMNVAVAVMQAAGRCTRSITDYSETYILDKSWQGFLNRNKRLFQPWFLASLMKIRSLEEVRRR